MTIIEMRVDMDCAGCQNRVKCSLEKLKGVDEVEIDMAMQKVTVTGWADQKKVLKTVRKTRRAELWQLPYSMDSTNHQLYNQHHINGPVTQYGRQPSSSYNYYKHGYDSHDRGGYYYDHHGQSSSMFGHQTGAAFSDENPHACSLM